jgi:hypothetical protein
MHPRKISSAFGHCLPFLAAQAAGQQIPWTSDEKQRSAASHEKKSPTIIVGKNHQRPQVSRSTDILCHLSEFTSDSVPLFEHASSRIESSHAGRSRVFELALHPTASR